MVSLNDFNDAPLLVVNFICNHCPFVKHIADPLAKVADTYMAKGVAFVAISSNDVENYPEDSPQKMAEEKAKRGYRFHTSMMKAKKVAKAYNAVCTPDIYVFAKGKGLAYHGQFDNTRPGPRDGYR